MPPCFLCICFGLVFLVATIIPQAYQSPPLETITIASKQFAIDPANIILGGTAVSAGGPAVTVDGAVVFEDGNDDVFVNGVEVLTGPTATAKTSFGSSSRTTSSECYHAASAPDISLKLVIEGSSTSAFGNQNSVTATTSSGSLLNTAFSSTPSLIDILIGILLIPLHRFFHADNIASGQLGRNDDVICVVFCNIQFHELK